MRHLCRIGRPLLSVTVALGRNRESRMRDARPTAQPLGTAYERGFSRVGNPLSFVRTITAVCNGARCVPSTVEAVCGKLMSCRLKVPLKGTLVFTALAVRFCAVRRNCNQLRDGQSCACAGVLGRQGGTSVKPLDSMPQIATSTQMRCT